MARRFKHEPRANHERWLVSYADFITLLFALFVLMFATAETDRSKAARISASVQKALQEGQVASALAGILGGTRDDKGNGNAMMMGPGGLRRTAEESALPTSNLNPSLDTLRTALKTELATGQLQITLEPRGLVISLREAAFFASGDDQVYPGTYSSIDKIAQVIRKLPNPVRLEGHTDSVPIHNSRFHSNWELSAARSIAMLELLISRFEVAPERLAVAGYADTAPVESNADARGRAHNRRVDIVVLSEMGAAPEPRPAAALGTLPPGHP